MTSNRWATSFGTSVQSSRLRRATSPSHRADGLTVRANEPRSTAMRPKVIAKPDIHSKLSSRVQWR